MHDCVRIYFNKRGPLPWSIDYGDQTTEVNVKLIHIQSAGTAITCEDFTHQDPEKPSAWLEFYRVNVEIAEERAVLWR